MRKVTTHAIAISEDKPVNGRAAFDREYVEDWIIIRRTYPA